MIIDPQQKQGTKFLERMLGRVGYRARRLEFFRCVRPPAERTMPQSETSPDLSPPDFVEKVPRLTDDPTVLKV
jgi:hypothetical protein